MASFDDIKKKLNIDELDKDTRSNMFNKFVEKGGQVVEEEKKKQRITHFNKDVQKTVNEKMKRKNDDLKSKQVYEDKNKQKRGTGADNHKEKKTKRYLSVFFNGLFQGIFTLSNKFTPKFSTGMQDEFGTIMSSLNYAAGLVLNLEAEKKWESYEMINRTGASNYEILMRIYNLYKINSITRIQNSFKRFNNIICPEIVDDLNLFYKEILILHPYWETIKEVMWKAMLVYQEFTKREPLIPKPKLNKFVDTLMGYYFPNIHIILNYNRGNKIPYEYGLMYEKAGITSEEEFGVFARQMIDEKKFYLAQIEKEKEERKKIFEDSVEKKEMDKIPKYIQKGLQIIDGVIEKIPSKVNSDNKAKNLQKNEKMLQFYYLFKEFDEEYSFILTTSQIRLTARSEGGKRIDVKQELEELNIKFNEITSFSREYFSLVDQVVKVNNDNANNPLALQQKMTLLVSKRAQIFNEIKARASIFFKRFSISLQKLINDYNGEKLLLQNGDDLLKFQKELGEKRKFESVQVIKAIAAAFSFTSAFHYYLTFGKLSSKSLYIEDDVVEEKKETPNTENIAEQPKNETK